MSLIASRFASITFLSNFAAPCSVSVANVTLHTTHYTLHTKVHVSGDRWQPMENDSRVMRTHHHGVNVILRVAQSAVMPIVPFVHTRCAPDTKSLVQTRDYN